MGTYFVPIVILLVLLFVLVAFLHRRLGKDHRLVIGGYAFLMLLMVILVLLLMGDALLYICRGFSYRQLCPGSIYPM